MRILQSSVLLFVLFCILSAGRDAFSELLLKQGSTAIDPLSLLFYFTAITELLFGTLLVTKGEIKKLSLLDVRVWFDVVLLNAFTLISFSAFFFAISTPFGAGLNAFVFYGTTPVFTAIAGAVLLNDRLNKNFWFALILGVLSVLVFSLDRVAFDIQRNTLWSMGLLSSLAGSLFAALYRVYSKRLLDYGMSREAVVFLRLLAIFLLIGAYSIVLDGQSSIHNDQTALILVLGLIGFSLPLFISITVLSKVNIRYYALLFFLMPAMTYTLSVALGNTKMYGWDLIGGILVLLTLAISEREEKILAAQGTGIKANKLAKQV